MTFPNRSGDSEGAESPAQRGAFCIGLLTGVMFNEVIFSTYLAYRVFCSFTHNQLTTLIARHADGAQLNYLKGAPEPLKQSILNIALSILCKAINLLPKFSDFDSNNLRKKIDEADLLWDLVAN